ncbi:MAG: BatA domain-containing protein [Chitinispirillaceae bacterium]|nr:BatA domain-containing protein [Chitinispirillaceae bacterium]
MNVLSFFRPEFLWALSFCAAVLLIHLLRRPRAKQFEFSTIRFFSETAVRATRMRRLRQLLLLCARLLAVITLVMVFARPYRPGDSLSLLRDPQLTLFAWVDPSPSMSYNEGNGTIMERALALLDSLHGNFHLSGRHWYYNEERREFVLHERDAPVTARFRHGPPHLQAMLHAWDAGRAGCSLPCLLLISDFQSATTALVDSFIQGYSGNAPLVCVSCAPRAPWNHSIRGSGAQDNGLLVKVSAHCAAQGRNLDSAAVSVSFSDIRAGMKKVSVTAGDTASVGIEAANASASPGGVLELDVSDPLQFDNKDYFAVEKRACSYIALLGEEEAGFPLAAAFRAVGGGWGPVIVRTEERATRDFLDSAALIAINAPRVPSRDLFSFLAHHSSRNKVFIMATGTGEEQTAVFAMLLARIAQQSGALERVSLDVGASVRLPDTISELWRGFPKLVTREAAVYRYVKGMPGEPLLRLDNGTPLVTAMADSLDRSFIFVATPLGVTEDNNLCETGFYVPCLDRITRYAVRRAMPSHRSWIAGIAYPNPWYGRERSASVFTDDTIFVEQWRAQQQVMINRPGMYKIVPQGEDAYWIAVRNDPAESRLEYRLPSVPDHLKQRIVVVNQKRFFEFMAGKGGFRSFLPWFMLSLFLLAEALLWDGSVPRRASK